MPAETFPLLLDGLLRTSPGRPLLTAYDESTGERVELSVATYANWVAKTASLLVEEYDLARGATLRVDLPGHWLGPVFLGAAWAAGLVVGDGSEPDAVVCGPQGLDTWAATAADRPVLACSLRPLGARFDRPLPPGVHDVGVEVWSQPDAFTAWDPPLAGDPAVELDGLRATQAEVCGGLGRPRASRVLSRRNPVTADGVPDLVGVVAGGGSLVLVSGLDGDPDGDTAGETAGMPVGGSASAERLAALARDERVDAD